jgi:hypothetical protein
MATPNASTAPALSQALPTPPVPTPPPPSTATHPSATASLAPPLPTPTVPTPPTTSTTAQPNPTKNPSPDTSELENTLERLKALAAKQTPTAKANPLKGGAPTAGGLKSSNITDQLSAEQRGAVGDKVRECWTKDDGALDIDKMSVMLTVTTDAGGVAREAAVGDADKGRLSDPRFRAFAERAIRAVLSARCAALPIPKDKLGKVNELTFRFRP